MKWNHPTEGTLYYEFLNMERIALYAFLGDKEYELLATREEEPQWMPCNTARWAPVNHGEFSEDEIKVPTDLLEGVLCDFTRFLNRNTNHFEYNEKED